MDGRMRRVRVGKAGMRKLRGKGPNSLSTTDRPTDNENSEQFNRGVENRLHAKKLRIDLDVLDIWNSITSISKGYQSLGKENELQGTRM